MLSGHKFARAALLWFAADAVFAATLSLSQASVAPGATVELGVTYQAQGVQVTALQFDLEYDDASLRITATTGPAASRSGKDLSTNEKRFLIAGLNQNTIADGVVALLSISAKSSAAGTYPLRFSRVSATDKDGKSVALQAIDGSISVSTTSGPQIRGDGVVHGGSFQPVIAGSTWVAIFGTNLAAVTRTWSAADFAGNRLPTVLDGVRVYINGNPAYVYFISPSQINALAPADDSEGPVSVQVVTTQGRGSVMATKKRVAPGFFMLDPEGRKYLAAVHSDGAVAGREGLFSGLATRPVKPGDVVLLYGTGFGPTDPPATDGELLPQALPLASPVVIRFGGAVATVLYAGLTAAGLYQFNVRVPDVPDGDVPVFAEIRGESTPPGCYLTVRR